MTEPVFPEIAPIAYEGPDSANALAYRYYDAVRPVLGRPMAEHLRIAVCYWHSWCWSGSDVFGAPTFHRRWLQGDPWQSAMRKLDANFEFIAKLGVPFFCFHDADLVPLGESLAEGREALARMADHVEARMAATGIRLLWGTANLFSHPRYMAGAATNPDPEVFAFAAGQVKAMLEMTHRLGGANYVLWGGREGYDTLLNTDLEGEQEQLGRFLSLVVEHKHKIGFTGPILVEPKPCEPTKHQYDRDAATVHAFLRRFGLEREVKLNLEVNHATLAGHSFEHEVAYAIANGLLGSFDINRGDPQNGWDTDQFPIDVRETALVMHRVLQAGGLTTGGCNFDAKVRRQSIDAADLFHAHVGGIDVLARGLLTAERMLAEGLLAGFVEERYAGWSRGLGADILAGRLDLEQLAALADGLRPEPRSGRQEYLENLVGRYV